jgi:Flagellar hook-length control protein FliK
MSVAPVGNAAAVAQAAALVLQGDQRSLEGFVLGQVLQAKVMQQLDLGRYLVRIAGQERMVESAVPLRPDEILSLRVAGSRERIELERVEREPSAAPQDAAQASDDLLAGLGGGRIAVVIEELFRRYRGKLEPQESDGLKRAVARAERPERMALAGLVLSKAGLPVHGELLEPLYRAIEARSGALAPVPDVIDPGAGAPRWWPPAQIVLNAQGGGAISHRVGMVPLEAGGERVEVEIAFFEEQDGRAPQAKSAIQHRKVVLALETERLGRIELRAVMADRHIRVALATESSASTNALLRHGEALANALAEAGWQVDEISHETRSASAMNGVVGAAVDHIITPGSVSRLA